MFSRLGGLAFLSGFLSSSFLSFSLESCNRVPSPCILHLSCTLLGLLSLGMAMSALLSRSMWQRCARYMHVSIYIYAYMCGWSCTLYNGLSWLCERPFLVMSALDLEVWVCAQRDGYRWVFMLYCVHDHCGVIIPIHVTKSVSPCMRCASICLMLWGALVCHSMSMLACAIYTSIKPCKCAIVH